jgi:hypothetical protein
MKKQLIVISLTVLMMIGCISRHLKPDKFEISTDVIQSFQSNTPIAVIIPKDQNEILVENLNLYMGQGAYMYYDLNELYKIADEHIKDVLILNEVPISDDSSKYLKFNITKIQYEHWGMFVFGCYMYVTVETSNGYKKDFKVQDQSGSHLDRAVGGAVSRAVEKIFQDRNIIKFIESNI